MVRKTRIAAACVLLVSVAGCNARKKYPDPAPGWHSADYSVIFGQLQRVPPPAATPDAPPAWTVRFGAATDPYAGELALTPPERLVGYSGGERVEVHGQLYSQPTRDQYTGRWYTVSSIRLWEGTH